MSAKFPSEFSLQSVGLPPVIPKDWVPGDGGMYATAKEGLDKPIEAAPQSPKFIDYQKWRLANPDKTEDCQILFVPSGLQTELGSSGFTSPSEYPEKIVTLSDKPSSYHIRYLARTKDGQPVCSIHPTHWDCPPEEEPYVAVGSKNELEIQCFIKNPTEGGLPGWVMY
ncbi:hypothetical protein FRC12_008020 [Ceratobasidium sp. 428]|nr:hypothetical protein FRC09_005604 [Ceratobasidium sp. 395]KAG8764563.1 hypothetical protein FRC12_008020 [Ceratobasidium sp. 428]